MFVCPCITPFPHVPNTGLLDERLPVVASVGLVKMLDAFSHLWPVFLNSKYNMMIDEVIVLD